MNGSSDDDMNLLSTELRLRPVGLVAFESILYIFVFTSTVVGNFLTLFIIFNAPAQRKVSTNLFIASLALSDFAMGILSMHLLLAVLITSEWPFGDFVCQYQGFISIVLAAASTQTLAWTAVNRYYRVVKSSQYNRIFNATKSKLIIAQIWITSLLAPLPYLFAGNKFVFNPGKFFCYLSINVEWFTALLVAVYVGIPASVISLCYFKVYQVVSKHNRRISQHRTNNRLSMTVDEIRTTHTLFIIVVVFISCWTPVLIIDIIDTARGKLSQSHTAYVCYTFFASISNAINPLIYGIMNTTLRGQYFSLLSCKFCNKLKGEKYSFKEKNEPGLDRQIGETPNELVNQI